MDDVQRPPPEQSLIDRFRIRARDRILSWREVHRSPRFAPAAGSETSLAILALVALGAALLTLALVLGWQRWTSRSQQPIDDQLPFLFAEPEPQLQADDGTAGPDVPRRVGTPAPPATAPPELVVHVSGAVSSPGIVALALGARVHDAIEAAGSTIDGADLDRVNLAAPVGDGERVHVPRVGEPDPVVVESRPAHTVAPGPEPSVVDLNRALQHELEALPGVGPATAAAIIETRNRRGPFVAIDELIEVDGIGPAKLELLRPHVSVVPVPPG